MILIFTRQDEHTKHFGNSECSNEYVPRNNFLVQNMQKKCNKHLIKLIIMEIYWQGTELAVCASKIGSTYKPSTTECVRIYC